MLTYQNRFNNLFITDINTEDARTFKIKLEQDKYTNDLVINIRQFIDSSKYSGPTKNGLFYKISSYEDFNALKNSLNILFNEIENHFQ